MAGSHRLRKKINKQVTVKKLKGVGENGLQHFAGITATIHITEELFMKFPLLTNAFGHPKLILEIGGNTEGLSEVVVYQPQQHRRRRVIENPMPSHPVTSSHGFQQAAVSSVGERI
jgi:hypothetical protein